jgi:hypothetical protein
MKEQIPFQNKLIEVMKEMIESRELTFTPDGGAILRYPGPAETKTLFFSFSPHSDTVSWERAEFSSMGYSMDILPQMCGTHNKKASLFDNLTGKICNFYGLILN